MKKVFAFIIKLSFLVAIAAIVCLLLNVAVLEALTVALIASATMFIFGMIWILLSIW